MKITLQQVLNFQQIYKNIRDEKLPLKTAYKFSCLMNELLNDVHFLEEENNKIIECYGARDINGDFKYTKDGNGILIQEDKREECNIEMTKLKNLEIEILHDFYFTLDELQDVKLSIKEIDALIPFIRE